MQKKKLYFLSRNNALLDNNSHTNLQSVQAASTCALKQLKRIWRHGPFPLTTIPTLIKSFCLPPFGARVTSARHSSCGIPSEVVLNQVVRKYPPVLLAATGHKNYNRTEFKSPVQTQTPTLVTNSTRSNKSNKSRQYLPFNPSYLRNCPLTSLNKTYFLGHPLLPNRHSSKMSTVISLSKENAYPPSTYVYEELNLKIFKSPPDVDVSNTHNAILSRPTGPYTVMRTVNVKRIFRLGQQANRIATALKAYVDKNCSDFHANAMQIASHFVDEGRMKNLICAVCESAVSGYFRSFTQTSDDKHILNQLISDYAEELRILVSIARKPQAQQDTFASPISSSDKDKSIEDFLQLYDVYVHVSQLPPTPKRPVNAVVDVMERPNASVKDSSWVHLSEERFKELIRKEEGENEVIMVDHEGRFLEGFSSNFFAFAKQSSSNSGEQKSVESGDENTKLTKSNNRDSVFLYTASEGVLHGTMRPMVLASGEKLGISVTQTAPTVSSLPLWVGCGISSTSRLFLPLHRLRFTETAFEFIQKMAPSLLVREPTLGDASKRTLTFDCSDEQVSMQVASLVDKHFESESEVFFRPSE